jgi:hypothetical protein
MGELVMLGEQIYSSDGKRTARRVLSTQPVNVEVSFEDAGKLAGVEGTNIGTYTSIARADGTLVGEGMGVFATAEAGLVTWKGTGVGTVRAGGALSYRGAICFEATSPKLSRLNSVAGVFEFEVDAAGNTRTKIWEWK